MQLLGTAGHITYPAVTACLQLLCLLLRCLPVLVVSCDRVSFELLGSLPAGSVLASDAAWFVSTAWNKAPLLLKFCRQEEAREWMKLALEFCHLAPSLQNAKKAMMEESLADIESSLKAEAASSPMEE